MLYLPTKLLLLAPVALANGDIPDAKTLESWNHFQEQYHRSFQSIEEEHSRFKMFAENLKLIQKANEKNADYLLTGEGENVIYSHLSPFADWTHQEFMAYQTLKIDDLDLTTPHKYNTTSFDKEDDSWPWSPPKTWDWRPKGAVSHIQNQGSCGSCWAFSTIANLEGVAFVQHKKLVKLSEFELVECDKNDSGCQGGLQNEAYKYLIDSQQGVVSQADYPYWVPEMIWANRCHTERLKQPIWHVKSFTFIGGPRNNANSEDDIARALVKYGPLAVAFDATSIQFYWKGISEGGLLGCNKKELNHGVAMVGYGVEDEGNGKTKPYWTIRNSWGTWWGESGYFRMLRGVGLCGINSYVVTATDVEDATKVPGVEGEQEIHV